MKIATITSKRQLTISILKKMPLNKIINEAKKEYFGK